MSVQSLLSHWEAPARFPRLRRGEAHVWKCALDPVEEQVNRLEALLAPDERARADRFLRPEHRRRFRVSRGVLRRLASAYVNASAEEIAFSYESQGKPRLEAHQHLRFNLAHSGDLALFAFALDHEVGVDIEHRRVPRRTDAIARRFFAEEEVKALEALPADQRVTAFYEGWCRKEAYMKATGKGMVLGLRTFAVTLGPEEAPRLLRTEEPEPPDGWSMFALDTEDRFSAALVIEGRPDRVRLLEFVL